MLFGCPEEPSPAFHLTGVGIRLYSTTTPLMLSQPFLISALPIAPPKTTTVSVSITVSATHKFLARG